MHTLYSDLRLLKSITGRGVLNFTFLFIIIHHQSIWELPNCPFFEGSLFALLFALLLALPPQTLPFAISFLFCPLFGRISEWTKLGLSRIKFLGISKKDTLDWIRKWIEKWLIDWLKDPQGATTKGFKTLLYKINVISYNIK